MIKLLVLTLLFFASSTQAQQVYNKLNVKELDVTSRVNVTSTTKSSKPCPAMTETQRNAIATPLNGSCIYNTTTLKLNVYNGTVWKAAGGGVDNWLTATAYSVDDIVIESSKIYQCLIAHTSGTFATDLAASRWVEISSTVPVNLTGPITSIGNATSIASQTGTGSTFVVQNTPTLTTPNIGAATGTSLTLTDKLVGAYQTPNNLLNNGDVELTDITPITCTTGTCTRTTTSGEFSQGTAALKVVPAANVLDASWIATTPLGIQKQGFARVIYKVPSTCSTTFVVRTMVDGATQTEVPTSKLIMDNTFRSIEVPLTFGSTSAGIKVYANGTCTGDTFFDGAILSQGLGLQNLQGDNVYSAKVSGAGVISEESKDFLTSCTNANPRVCTFTSGVFTTAPNCTVTASGGNGRIASLGATTTVSTLSIATTLDDGSSAQYPTEVHCQKSGNDYLASSANVYSQANQNVSALYTGSPPTGTLAASFNTITFGTKVKDTHNAYSGGTYTVPVSASYDISTAVAVSGTYNGAQQLRCDIYVDGTSKYGNSNAPTTSIGRAWVNLSVKAVSFSAGQLITIRCYNDGTGLSYTSDASVQYFSIARSDSNAIVGSFENVPTVPGAGARIDTFTFRFGTTNGATSCTASPCNFLEQIGNAVTTVTRSSTGRYSAATSKTYTKLYCVPVGYSSSAGQYVVFEPSSCTNCSSAFVGAVNLAAAVVDVYATVTCQGTY